jgi:hypothetical protein
MMEREKVLVSLLILIKVLMLSWGSSLMISSKPPKVPHPNTYILGVKPSTYDFLGGKGCKCLVHNKGFEGISL